MHACGLVHFQLGQGLGIKAGLVYAGNIKQIYYN